MAGIIPYLAGARPGVFEGGDAIENRPLGGGVPVVDHEIPQTLKLGDDAGFEGCLGFKPCLNSLDGKGIEIVQELPVSRVGKGFGEQSVIEPDLSWNSRCTANPRDITLDLDGVRAWRAAFSLGIVLGMYLDDIALSVRDAARASHDIAIFQSNRVAGE